MALAERWPHVCRRELQKGFLWFSWAQLDKHRIWGGDGLGEEGGVFRSITVSNFLTLPDILAGIAAGHSSAALAESSYSDGVSTEAEALHVEAERRHTAMLHQICGLTDAEADRIEPAFSSLEKQLSRLRSLSLTSAVVTPTGLA